MSRKPIPEWIARRGCTHHGLTAIQRAVLMCLWDHADGQRKAFPGIPTITAETGFSDRSVKYALVDLEARRFITRVEQPSLEPGKWRRKAVQWSLTANPSGVLRMQELAG